MSRFSIGPVMDPNWCYLTVLISVLTIACFTFTDLVLSNLFLFAHWQAVFLPHVFVCYKKLYLYPSVCFLTTEEEHFSYILGLNILAYLYLIGGYLGWHGGAVVSTGTLQKEVCCLWTCDMLETNSGCVPHLSAEVSWDWFQICHDPGR